jgi:phage protein D
MPQSQTQDQEQQNNQLLTPSFKILVDGQPLDARIESRVLFIKAESNLEILDMFEIRFFDYDLELVNSDDLAIGKSIEVKLGYQESQLTTIADCEIVSWEPEYPPGGAAYLTIRGYDKSFRLSREKKSRSFVEMKDSDIANQIAREMGLTPNVDATTEVHPYVFQRNQANLEFLLERAQRIMYEMYIDGNDLYFRRPQSDQSERVILKWGESLGSFSPRLSSFSQVSEVVVRGWDPKSKKEIVGRAGGGDEHTTLGGAQTATQIAEAAHGSTKSFKVNKPIHSQAEADGLARAHFNKLSMNFITGEGKALGDPEIKAGTVIDIEGLGDKFSGPYYVIRATHIFSASGYSTKFEVKKNSLGRPPAPPEEQAEEEQEQNQHYLDVTLQDSAEEPVAGMDYVIIAPDGTRYTGSVGSDGKIHKDNLPEGECQIIFKQLTNAHWEVDQVNCGDEIRLLVDCPAHDEGDSVTFEIYKLFKEESGDAVTSVDGTVDANSQAEAVWTYEYQEEDEGTSPRFIFKAKSGSLETMSDVLTVVDVFEATLTDSDGNPVANAGYVITLPDGSQREGVTNDEGQIVEEELPIGNLKVRMEDGSTLEQSS